MHTDALNSAPMASLSWPVEPLGLRAVKIQDGTHFSPKTTEGPYRYLTSKNVRFGYLDVEDSGWISSQEHRAIYTRCDVQPGDLLLTKDGANTGNAAINTLKEEFSLLSSVAIIRCDEQSLVGRYVLQYLLSAEGQRRLKDGMSGNAITRLTLHKIKSFEIPVPPLRQQQRIADILDAADAAIRQTAAVVAKLRQAKAGLLHDLLTRGLDERGQLRDPVAHPEQFKDTRVGRMPAAWKSMQLIAVLLMRPKNGYSPQAVDEWTGTSMLGLGCLTPHGFSPVQLKNAPSGDPRVSSALLREGDLLLSRSNTRDLVGLVGRYRNIGTRCIYPDLMMRLVPGPEVSPDFLELAIRSSAVRCQLTNRAIGTSGSMLKINSRDVLETWVPVPSGEEQSRIMEALRPLDSNLESEEASLEKLKLQKRGLMHDLLTGRVRV